MTRQEAMSKLQRLWGKRALYRIGERLSSQEERDAMRAKRQELRAGIDAVIAETNRRLKECDWYQELRAREQALRAEMKKVDGVPYYKFTIGRRDSILGFFGVEAQGDTWEECFAKVEQKQKAKAS